ncbi:hypothetical protein PG301_20460 [Parageobacillus sp. G301]|nr:hypothetical protein PG301_20460 [Parageobacillus sp. G301]
MIGIDVLDHLIVCEEKFILLEEKGYIRRKVRTMNFVMLCLTITKTNAFQMTGSIEK